MRVSRWWAGRRHVPLSLHCPLHPLQVKPALTASSFSGKQLQQRAFVAKAARPSVAVVCAAATQEGERLRLNNLSPQPGSKKNKNRKGRGYGAGQVLSAATARAG